MEKKCCVTDCNNAVSHSFGFPGEPLQFICEEHRKGQTALASPDFTKLATFTPIAEFVDATPSTAPLCSHKAHNGAHVRPAVLAYSWPGEPVERGEGFEPGVACPGCVIELVGVAKQNKWDLSLAELS